ncbi:MAG: hypothetical protein GY754_00430 [bacterium]|nr:hypothetical protein [bacterium]
MKNYKVKAIVIIIFSLVLIGTVQSNTNIIIDKNNFVVTLNKEGTWCYKNKKLQAGKLYRFQSNTILKVIDRVVVDGSERYKIQKWSKKPVWIDSRDVLKLSTAKKAYIKAIKGSPLFSSYTKDTKEKKIIARIPYREKVVILGAPEKVYDIFFKVKWNNREGWVNISSLSFVNIPDYRIKLGDEELRRYWEKNKCAYIMKNMNQFGNKESDIIKKLGSPGKITRKKYKNIYLPGKFNIVSSLFYENFLIKILKAPFNKEFVIHVSFENPRLIPHDKYMDKDIQYVYNDLGVPDRDYKNEFIYSGEASEVTFYTVNRKVKKIYFRGGE